MRYWLIFKLKLYCSSERSIMSRFSRNLLRGVAVALNISSSTPLPAVAGDATNASGSMTTQAPDIGLMLKNDKEAGEACASIVGGEIDLKVCKDEYKAGILYEGMTKGQIERMTKPLTENDIKDFCDKTADAAHPADACRTNVKARLLSPSQ